jgi:LysR family transcriptional regulator, pca operon transcriptional activator
VAIIEHGSITRCAKALNTTQPTLTRRIRRLEAVLGRDLLERTRSGVSPTEFGREVIYQALIVERALRAIISRSGLSSDAPGLEIRVGATPLPALYIIPEMLRIVSETERNVVVQVIEGFLPGLLTQLRKGEIDLVLASPSVDWTDKDLMFKRLFDARVCVVVRSKHPATQAKHSSLAELSKYAWALPNRQSTYRRRIEREFERQQLKLPSKQIEMPSPSAMLRIVKTSDVVTALPYEIVKDELRAGTMGEIKGAWRFLAYPYGVFARKQPAPSAAIRRLLRAIERTMATLARQPSAG